MTINEYLNYTCDDSKDLFSGRTVRIKKGEGRSLKAGGQWIYDNEIDAMDSGILNGDIVRVDDFDGYVMGFGAVSQNSRIRVRMLTRDRNERITPAFIAGRVLDALDYRRALGSIAEGGDYSSCRLIFGEADFLPGITLDKYEDILVIESLFYGLDRFKELILSAVIRSLRDKEGLTIRGIYERSGGKARSLEGLPPYSGYLSEPFDTAVTVRENGLSYLADVADGQKTGFFLDQKLNRLAIRPFCRGARVLDCFTHTGSFALNAAAAGALHVTAADISQSALDIAAANAKLNGLEDRIDFVCTDVFSYLPELAASGERFDVVILDPPAFTKARGTIQSAQRGYREINRRGIGLVRPGGFLATATCSHFMDEEHFAKVIDIAAHDAHRRLKQIEKRAQAPDHPILWGAGSSAYLQFYLFQVL